MLALLKSPDGGDLLHFTFGESFDPRDMPVERRIGWALEDFEVRRMEIANPPLSQTIAELQRSVARTSDTKSAVAIIRALGFLRAVNSAVSLYPFLDHAEMEVTAEAILALGRIGSLASFHRLERFLDSSEPSIKRAAIVSLSKQLDRAAFQRLDSAAASSAELRAIVRKGKRRVDAFEAKDMTALVAATLDSEEWEDLWPAMRDCGPETLEILVDTARPIEVRRRALGLVAISGYREARGYVEHVLRNVPELRDPAVVAAGRVRATNCVELLAELLANADPDLARDVARALGEIRSSDALPALLSQWSAHGGSLRQELLLALQRLGRVSGRHHLESSLRAGEAWQQPWTLTAIDDGMQLHRRYSKGLFDARLGDADPTEAIVLLAVLGEAEEADKMQAFAGHEDAGVRELASLAGARMRGRTARR